MAPLILSLILLNDTYDDNQSETVRGFSKSIFTIHFNIKQDYNDNSS